MILSEMILLFHRSRVTLPGYKNPFNCNFYPLYVTITPDNFDREIYENKIGQDFGQPLLLACT
jgi:hypothetical protein